MAASIIRSMHINKRVFTKQDHDEVINEQEECLPNKTLAWNLFLRKKVLHYIALGNIRLFLKKALDQRHN